MDHVSVDDVGVAPLPPAVSTPSGGKAAKSVANTVGTSFRHVIAGSLTMALLLGGLLGWLLLASRPAVARYEHGVAAVQNERAALLDQETGIRGHLLTHELHYLEPYRMGVANMVRADQSVLQLATGGELTASVIETRNAEQLWVDEWALPAAAGQVPGISTAAGKAFLDKGKTLFDAYRKSENHTAELASARLDDLRRTQVTVLVAVAASALLVAISASVIAVSLRSRLQRRILAPVDVLLSGLQAVRQGDLQRRLPTEGPIELSQVIDGFNEMTSSLSTAAARAEVSELRIGDQARQLRAVLGMVREIGGSLNSGYVMAAITDGAMAISGASRAVVWLQDGTNPDSLARVWDSLAARTSRAGAPDEADATDGNDAHVQTAAKFGRTTEGRANDGTADRLAVPLIVGAQVIGVLELILPGGKPLSDELVDVVETLSIHAATAIEATRLHEGTTHASEHDALTGLANRRRLETDLASECNRSLRYGNNLSFVMLDLDHFKRLNDTYGHQRGDEALQGCALVILETLRTTDTAYRYGGEELAVIARETNLEGVTQLAERIRAAIERRYPGSNGAIRLTASFGVASLPDHAATPEGLIACADDALYVAKAAGRNQVAQAVATAPDAVRPPNVALVPPPK
jgi:diguanylate cyclase (GGDEF)-like protein